MNPSTKLNSPRRGHTPFRSGHENIENSRRNSLSVNPLTDVVLLLSVMIMIWAADLKDYETIHMPVPTFQSHSPQPYKAPPAHSFSCVIKRDGQIQLYHKKTKLHTFSPNITKTTTFPRKLSLFLLRWSHQRKLNPNHTFPLRIGGDDDSPMRLVFAVYIAISLSQRGTTIQQKTVRFRFRPSILWQQSKRH